MNPSGPPRDVDGAAPAAPVSLGIPAYVSPVFHPDEWAVLGRLDPGSIVVVNPDSGPSRDMASHYGDAVRELRDLGVRVYGYLTVSYGRRATRDIRGDVAAYHDRLGVDGVFFDQVPSTLDDLGPSLRVADEFRPRGCAVALNPGQPVMPSVAFDAADQVVTFEGTYDDYVAMDLPRPAVGSAEHWHLVHGVAPEDVDAAVLRAAASGASYVFASTGHMPNPWTSMITALSREAVR